MTKIHTFKHGRRNEFTLTVDELAARAKRRIESKGPEYGSLKSLMCCVGGSAGATARHFCEMKGIPFYNSPGDVAKAAALFDEKKPDGIVGMPGFLLAIADQKPTYRASCIWAGGALLTPVVAQALITGLLAPSGNGYGEYGVSELGSLTLISFKDVIKMPQGCVGKPCPGTEIDIRGGRIFARTPVSIKKLAGPDGFIDTGDDGWLASGYLFIGRKPK